MNKQFIFTQTSVIDAQNTLLNVQEQLKTTSAYSIVMVPQIYNTDTINWSLFRGDIHSTSYFDFHGT